MKYNLFVGPYAECRKGLSYFKWELDNIINLKCKVKSVDGIVVPKLWHFKITSKLAILHLVVNKNQKEYIVPVSKIPLSETYTSNPHIKFSSKLKSLPAIERPIVDCYITV